MNYSDRLEHILCLAEELYGPRTHTRTFRVINFHDRQPQVFYPSPSEIEIRLGLPCQTELERGCYQLAHEALHCLSPVDIWTATTLEEGLATSFAHSYIRNHGGTDWNHSPTFWSGSGDQRYDLARGIVEMFLSSRPNAIRRLREKQPVISAISADLIIEYYPEVPSFVAQILASRFHHRPSA